MPCSSTHCPGRPPYVLFPLTAGLPLMGSRSCCANSPSGLRETPPPAKGCIRRGRMGGGLKGRGEGGGGFGWDLPSSQGPPMGRNVLRLNPLGTEITEAKCWLSASNIGRGGGGGGGGAPAVYGRPITSLPLPLCAFLACFARSRLAPVRLTSTCLVCCGARALALPWHSFPSQAKEGLRVVLDLPPPPFSPPHPPPTPMVNNKDRPVQTGPALVINSMRQRLREGGRGFNSGKGGGVDTALWLDPPPPPKGPLQKNAKIPFSCFPAEFCHLRGPGVSLGRMKSHHLPWIW